MRNGSNVIPLRSEGEANLDALYRWHAENSLLGVPAFRARRLEVLYRELEGDTESEPLEKRGRRMIEIAFLELWPEDPTPRGA